MDSKLIQLLVCPVCKGPLIYKKPQQELICKPCRLAYAIKDDIPVKHLLSRADGTPLTRLSTDGSAIEVTPVAAGTLVVVTRNGGVYGFQPE